MNPEEQGGGQSGECLSLQQQLISGRNLIIVSNRGPVTFQFYEDGTTGFERGGGGLVTALLGLARQVQGTWISAALSEADRVWHEGEVQIEEGEAPIRLEFIAPDADAYQGYYNVIANPLLWFLQHSLWDYARAPSITRETWEAWEQGYSAVNRQFAQAVAQHIRDSSAQSLVMLQDYHLYLAPRVIRQYMRARRTGHTLRQDFVLTHFVHIPWPGPEDWAFLPPAMRQGILEGMCANDLIGFQTRGDALNFIRSVETLLPGAHVNYGSGRIWLHNHASHVRDFPISIDVQSLRQQATGEESQHYFDQFKDSLGGMQMIVRIDRIEPSKNIARGFHAYEEMLEEYPEHREKVVFLALLVPSRMEVEEYKQYLDVIMAAAGRVNAHFGTSHWEPVRVMVGDNIPRAVAAMRLYDVLLVNPVADGMNLVAKEGPTLNECCGVVVLSERAGASQQLGQDALLVSPCDVYSTAQALHQGLVMPEGERRARAERLKTSIEQNDIHAWLCDQLHEINRLEKGAES